MPTAHLTRRGKRRPARVTLAMRRRDKPVTTRRHLPHASSTGNPEVEISVRKKTCIFGAAPVRSSRLKKKHPRTGETLQSKMPPPIFRVELHNEEMEKISCIIQSLSGEATIPSLLDVLTDRGFERNLAVDKVQQLVDARKVIIDNEGYICWTYNPVLAAHYRGHPELRIR